MKLFDAVVQGRFLALDTVEECVRNILIHSNSYLNHKTHIAEELELLEEFAEWQDGRLILDEDLIDARVACWQFEYEEWQHSV